MSDVAVDGRPRAALRQDISQRISEAAAGGRLKAARGQDRKYYCREKDIESGSRTNGLVRISHSFKKQSIVFLYMFLHPRSGGVLVGALSAFGALGASDELQQIIMFFM